MKLIISSIIGFALVLSVQSQSDPCVGQSNGFLEDPTSCSTYWACSNGVGKKQKCPDDFPIFSPSKQGCQKDDGSCQEFCPAGQSKDPKPLPGSCRKYLMCINGFVLERDCGAGYAFDYTANNCDVEWKADCLTCPTDGKLHYLPDKKDCAGYYLCLNNVVYPRKCGTDLYYDEASKKCTFEKSVDCKYKDFTTPPAGSTPAPSTTLAPPDPTTTVEPPPVIF